MATPTPNTRVVAHAVVGTAATVALNKAFGTRGLLALMTAFVVGAMLHEMLDAPIAQLMASAGLQF